MLLPMLFAITPLYSDASIDCFADAFISYLCHWLRWLLPLLHAILAAIDDDAAAFSLIFIFDATLLMPLLCRAFLRRFRISIYAITIIYFRRWCRHYCDAAAIYFIIIITPLLMPPFRRHFDFAAFTLLIFRYAMPLCFRERRFRFLLLMLLRWFSFSHYFRHCFTITADYTLHLLVIIDA